MKDNPIVYVIIDKITADVPGVYQEREHAEQVLKNLQEYYPTPDHVFVLKEIQTR